MCTDVMYCPSELTIYGTKYTILHTVFKITRVIRQFDHVESLYYMCYIILHMCSKWDS